MQHQENQFTNLIKDILVNGEKKPVFGSDRYILSVIGRELRFDLRESVPVYTTKRVFHRGAMEEMLWFIKGDGDVVDLNKRRIRIWNKWAVKHWNEINATDLTLEQYEAAIANGEIKHHYLPIHYTNMTNWESKSGIRINQIDWINKQLPRHPHRKSYFVSAWEPSQTYHMADECGEESVVLPACHVSHQILVSNNRLTMVLTIRSNDIFVGNPFNVSQYAYLVYAYSALTGYEPGELVIQIGDAHIYSNDLERVEIQLSRDPYPFPQLELTSRDQKGIKDFNIEDFVLKNYESHGVLDSDVTLVGGYA